MIALVTQPDGTSRGQPWVSFLLALVLAGGYGALRTSDLHERQAEIDTRLVALADAWREHPYLELDPRLVAAAGGPEVVQQRVEDWTAERGSRGLAKMPESIVRRAQRRFDDSVAEVFARQAELPTWQHGVVDASSAPATWISHFAYTDRAAALAVGLFFTLCLGIALEGVWGPLLFAPFAVAAIAAGGFLYGRLHGDLGMPWLGASGLGAALLGAYCVQAIRWPALLFGAISMPAWLMPLVWIALEYGVARGIRPSTLSLAPFETHAVLFGFGVAVGLAMRALGVEEKLKEIDEKASELVSNPVLDRAMAAHEAGRSAEAHELLHSEIERHPGNRDLTVAFWTVCNSLSRPADALPTVLAVVRDDLKRRRFQDALALWKELLPVIGEARVDATLLVRMGEVLLDAGEPADALHTLGVAVDSERPLSSPLAIRVVRVARDLDPALTARAARRALQDPQLDPARRGELEALSEDVQSGVMDRSAPPAAGPAAVAPPPAPVPEEHDRSVFDKELPEASGLEPQALAADALSTDATPVSEADEDPSLWNDPGVVQDLSAELADDSPRIDAAYDPTSFGSVDLAAEDPETTAPLPAPDGGTATPDAPSLGLGSGPLRRIRLLEATPLALEESAIKLEISGRGKSRLEYDRIDAIGVSAVSGLSARPVLLVDLVLNWMVLDGEPLKVIRLRSDRFDPVRLVPDAQPGARLDALKKLLARLLRASGATPLPDGEAARGEPFASHADLDAYHREVLMVDGIAD